MPISYIFWGVMILLLLSGFFSGRPAPGQPWNWPGFGMTLVTWILFALLGWKVFGPIVK